MKPAPLYRFAFAVPVAALTLGFISSCASTEKVSAQATSGGKILTEADYTTVYVTGSNLPVRVPKVPLDHPLPGDPEFSTMSPEALAELNRRAQSPGRH